MNQAFSKIWIIVVLVVTIVGGIFVWQYFGVPKEEIGALKEEITIPEEIVSEKVEEVIKEEIADWKTYRNEEFGFEIKYPADWHIKTERDPVGLLMSFSNYPPGEGLEREDPQKVLLGIVEVIEMSLTEWLDKAKGIESKIEEITIDSEKGYKAIKDPVSISVAVAKDKYLYFLMVLFPDTLLEKTFDQMLSTFRFLE